MINIMLFGAAGKMGRMVASVVAESEQADIACGIDLLQGNIMGRQILTDPYEFSGAVDVIIDFSHPDMLKKVLAYAVDKGIPCVIATTGYTTAQVSAIEKAALEIPVFFTANMSMGINLMVELCKKAAEFLGDGFDVEIIEKHHNRKIDSPSGTALLLADSIKEIRKRAEYIYDRHSVRRKRGKNEIGISSLRGGTIVGEHSVLFCGNEECVEIKHNAFSREVFAQGAVRAAMFVADKGEGLYNMKNILE